MTETLERLVTRTDYQYTSPAQQTITGPYYSQDKDPVMYSEWSDGSFDCCSDLGTCILCALYPFGMGVLIYLIMERLPKEYRRHAALFGIEIFAEPIIASCFFLLVGWDTWIIATYMIYIIQRAVADNYKIDDPGSLCRSCFCPCCLLAQLARHTGRAQGFIR